MKGNLKLSPHVQSCSFAIGSAEMPARNDCSVLKASFDPVTSKLETSAILEVDVRAIRRCGQEIPVLMRPVQLVKQEQRMVVVEDMVVVGLQSFKIIESIARPTGNLVGRKIQLGSQMPTVIGVMPAGFKFPVRNTKLWVPLDTRAPADYVPRTGRPIVVFGRLRDGVSRQQAEVELAAIEKRLVADSPKTHERLRPRLPGLTSAITDLRPPPDAVFIVEFVALLLLAVACGNVGTLTLARTASRTTEFAVRTALGADRGRIISQLFVEALILATVAAAVGLTVAQLLVMKFDPQLGPAWVHLSLSPRTVALGVGLALFSAVIAGLLPAFKATGRNVQVSLQRVGVGGSGFRFGLGATLLIVSEVALAVGFLSVVGTLARNVISDPSSDIGVTADEYLTAQLGLVGEVPLNADSTAYWKEFRARLGRDVEEIGRRIGAEPGVRGVAMATVLPGMTHQPIVISVDGADSAADARARHVVGVAWVNPGFLAGLGLTAIVGRDFDSRDFGTGRQTVLVNRSFVNDVLHGQSAIGRSVRYVDDRGQPAPEAFEIVGVVNDLGTGLTNRKQAAGVYYPVIAGGFAPRVAVHVKGNPAMFGARLRTIVASVDPEMVVSELVPLDEAVSATLREARFTSYAFAALACAALVLSIAGLYALMSFTVSTRSYEIAVRSALGAPRAHILAMVLTRSLVHLAIGVAIGGGLGSLLAAVFATSATSTRPWLAVIATVGTVMTLVGLSACMVPTVRALRVEPIRALKGVI
jgi:predicted permease